MSLDDLRLMFSGKPFDATIEKVVATASDALCEAVVELAGKKKVDALFDATNVSRARRRPLIRLAQRHGLTPVAVFMDCPVSVAHERNQRRPNPVPRAVLENFARRLERPTSDEGFAEVIRVTSASGQSPGGPAPSSPNRDEATDVRPSIDGSRPEPADIEDRSENRENRSPLRVRQSGGRRETPESQHS